MLRRLDYAAIAAVMFGVLGFAAPAATKEFIAFNADYEPGTIIIVNSERKLYYVLGQGRAIAYPVAVGKPGDLWTGESVVTRKVMHPGWSPTPAMRRRNPRLPRYVPPGPRNPLGVRAMYLGWSYYLIHGTNSPWSIGRAASSGCIRMLNEHVVDLYERVHLGAPVVVVSSLNAVLSQR